jgi:hypothetical protein
MGQGFAFFGEYNAFQRTLRFFLGLELEEGGEKAEGQYQ